MPGRDSTVLADEAAKTRTQSAQPLRLAAKQAGAEQRPAAVSLVTTAEAGQGDVGGLGMARSLASPAESPMMARYAMEAASRLSSTASAHEIMSETIREVVKLWLMR